METWDAITSRRNVREFDSRPVDPADLDQVLEAARRAPSARNNQWWDLIVITDPEQLQALSGVWQGAGHVARSQATIAVIAPPGHHEQASWIQFDLGQMTIQLMIAAADLGIGTAHAWVQDQDVARDLLGFPDDRECHWLIALGYPSKPLRPIKDPARRPFDEVVHRGGW